MTILLTGNSQCDKVPTSSEEEVGKVRGSIREYRKGHFQVYFSYKGEKFFLYKYLDGTPLVHVFHARRLLEHINSLIDSHKFDPTEWRADKPFLFEKAIEIWIDLSECSPEWLQRRESIARRILIPHFKSQDVREIRKIHIDQFYKELKKHDYSPKYLYNVMGELKAFFNFIRESIPKVPGFPKIGYQQPPIRWLSGEQQNQVFEFIPDRHKPIFIFMRYTGCRPGEAAGLLRKNVFIQHNPPYFILASVIGEKGQLKENTKTKLARPLPVIAELIDVMKPKYVTPFIFSHHGRQYTVQRLYKIWKYASEKAGKKYGTPVINLYNGLKHSFGCQRLNQGFTLGEIQAVMGHTDARTTKRYSNYLTEKLTSVMRGSAKVVQGDFEFPNSL
jgi:integrase